jgi:peptide-methionine (S)-S-oxide reductase
LARACIGELDQAHIFGARIVTKIEPGKSFFPAEAYHQDFLTRHPNHPYIAIDDIPEVEALQRLYPDLYRVDPALVADAKSGQDARALK